VILESKCRMLVEYLTRYSDYMTNIKILAKDMAISRSFLEPFKWDTVDAYKDKLGDVAAGLLTKCFESETFYR